MSLAWDAYLLVVIFGSMGVAIYDAFQPLTAISLIFIITSGINAFFSAHVFSTENNKLV